MSVDVAISLRKRHSVTVALNVRQLAGGGGGDVTIENSDQSFQTTVTAPTTYVLADQVIKSSGTAFSTNYPSANPVPYVIPDINWTDSDLSPQVAEYGTPIVCTPSVGGTPTGILYQFPLTSHQNLISYATGDEGDQSQSGIYDYPERPSNPADVARLNVKVTGAASYRTLLNDNAFGNKDRFTDDAGGQTYANNLVLDHLTGLMWYRLVLGVGVTDFNGALSGAASATFGGFTDWRLPNLIEQLSVMDYRTANMIAGSPFSDGTAHRLWTSTTRVSITTQAFAILTNAGTVANRIKTSAVDEYMICRNNHSLGAGVTSIAYQRPRYSGQITSYSTYDEGWQLANDVLKYTPPNNPSFIQQLDQDAADPAVTLLYDNAFGNKNRFTDENGLQVFGNDYFIDHLTGLGYRITLTANGTSDWPTCLSDADSYSNGALGFSDFRLVSAAELYSLARLEAPLRTLGHTPASSQWNVGNNQIATRDTYVNGTTSCYYYEERQGRLLFIAKTFTNFRQIYVRNHY